MSRYIDADMLAAELRSSVNGKNVNWQRNLFFPEMIELMVETLHDVSTDDDVVKVVRCEDCRYSIENDGGLVIGARYCNNAAGTISGFYEPRSVLDKDFCSYGEQMEDERR